MQPQGSLQFSKQFAIGIYPEKDKASLHKHNPIYLPCTLILSFHLRPVFKVFSSYNHIR